MRHLRSSGLPGFVTGFLPGLLPGLLTAFLLPLSITAAAPATSAAQSQVPDYPLTGLPALGTPVDCTEPGLCSVQNYMDFSPGAEARDHTCGPLTYNAHKGIDIRLRSVTAMKRGIAVLAASDGTVIGRKNDVPDRLLNDTETRVALLGPVKPANSVSLYHGNGWVTHYSHLRRGSVKVRNGQKVKRGETLGLIGASGSTNFPHLHFVLQYRDKIVDPYSGRYPESGCGKPPYHSFWNEDAIRHLAYRESGVLISGFAEQTPSPATLRSGHPEHQLLPANAERLVFWTQIWGLRRSDRIRMRLFSADGNLLKEVTQRARINNPIDFRYVAVPRQTEAWPRGVYRGEYFLERPDSSGSGNFDEVLKIIRKIEVR